MSHASVEAAFFAALDECTGGSTKASLELCRDRVMRSALLLLAAAAARLSDSADTASAPDTDGARRLAAALTTADLLSCEPPASAECDVVASLETAVRGWRRGARGPSATSLSCAGSGSDNNSSGSSASPHFSTCAAGPLALLDARAAAVLVLSALWCAAKFWAASLQFVTLNALLFRLVSRHAEGGGAEAGGAGTVPGAAKEQAEAAADALLLAPPPPDGDFGCDARGGLPGAGDMRSDPVGVLMREVEEAEFVLFRCSGYVVPL